MPWEEVRKVCQDYATAAIRTLATLPRKQDQVLRFVYVSGHFATRTREGAHPILKDNNMLENALMRVCAAISPNLRHSRPQ